MSEVSERYARVAGGFEARLAGVRPEQWDSSTPCEEWNVRDVVVHVIGTHRTVVGRLADEAPAEVDRDGDLMAQWGEAREAVEPALADPDRASQVVGGTFGEQPFESLVGRLLCADTLFHTWDVARATGQDESLDPAAVAAAREFLESIDEAIRRPGGFAPKIPAPAGADPQTALLNFGGRATD